MPTWNDILAETTRAGSTNDVVRRRYLKKLAAKTKRNIIIYYSGWLQKSEFFRHQAWDFLLNDADKSGLMSTIYEMDRSKGLDLILHTPGGDMAATESLVDYLRQMFGKDIRAIVPQIAMSGGTMIALACKEIVMGTHSNLGPIDPQFFGVPALKEVQAAPHTAPIWQVILSKYGPSQISESLKVIAWADQMTPEWLKTGMFDGDQNADAKINRIIQELGDHAITLESPFRISSAIRSLLAASELVAFRHLPRLSLKTEPADEFKVINLQYFRAHRYAFSDYKPDPRWDRYYPEIVPFFLTDEEKRQFPTDLAADG